MRSIRWAGVVVGLAAASLLVGCSGASPDASSGTADTQPLAAHPEKAGINPTDSAKVVCGSEAREDLNGSLGVDASRITPPTWVDHLYSCTYVYPNGAFTLSVKELSSAQATTGYFEQLARTLGRRNALHGLGQGAFLTASGSAVVRKDYKMLLVDVGDVPAKFVPTLRRFDVAQTIATVIMGCWTGA